MSVVRKPVSLIKGTTRRPSTLEILGLPPGFLELLGFGAINLITQPGDVFAEETDLLEHEELEIEDQKSMLGALEDLYDQVKHDPAAFEAAAASPAVKAQILSDLQNLSTYNQDGTNRFQKNNPALRAFEHQRQTLKNSQTQTRPQEQKSEKQALETSENRSRREKDQESDFDFEELEHAAPLTADNEASTSDPAETSEEAGPDLTDLVEVSFPEEEQEAREQLAGARAWDHIGKIFGIAASDAVMRKETPYKKDVAKAAFERAEDGPFKERLDREKPASERNLEADRSGPDIQIDNPMNTLPV